MSTEDKIESALGWFLEQSLSVRCAVFHDLLEHAIESEWVGVWDAGDLLELEKTNPLYFTTTGEPVGCVGESTAGDE